MSPKTLQYHLENRHATWLELFFDLVFVASISVVTHNLAHTHQGHIDTQQLLMFPVEFLPVWWIWATHTLYANRFDTDGKGHRITSLLMMFLMVTTSAFLGNGWFEHYGHFIAFYVAIRWILAGLYFSSANKLDASGGFARIIGLRIITGAVISGSSVLFDEPLRQIILISGIGFEMIVGAIVGRKMADTDPVHREHLVERIGLLTIIVLGESVISLVDSLRGIVWDTDSITAAVSGFMIIGTIWWIYFDSFSIMERLKTLTHGFLLIYSHIFLAMGLVILANLIRHGILSDLVMYDFRILAITGVVFFYLGMQLVYFVSLPPYRLNTLMNSAVPIGVTVGSTFLPDPTYALLGMMSGLFIYTFLGLKVTTEKDISQYLAGED